MRNLLQNRSTTVVLVAVAALALYWQRGELLTRWQISAQARTAPDEASPPADNETAFVVTTNSPPRYLTDLANWRTAFPDNDLRRDPFSAPKRDGEDSSTPESLTPDLQEIKLELQAISIQPQGRYAVINHEIVAQGDKFQGFLVEKIERGEVTLTGDLGKRLLQLRFDIPGEKPSDGSDPVEPVDPPKQPPTGTPR